MRVSVSFAAASDQNLHLPPTPPASFNPCPTTAAPAAACSRRWLYLLRGVLGYCSVSSLYMAVSLLPMGDAAVLSFLR